MPARHIYKANLVYQPIGECLHQIPLFLLVDAMGNGQAFQNIQQINKYEVYATFTVCTLPGSELIPAVNI